MSFRIFQNEKTPSQAIKTRSSKSRKLTFFQRGQPMVLVQKQPFFQLFFLRNKARKMSFTIFQNKKSSFQAIKTRSSKSRKIDIFPWFWSKKAIFLTFFFYAIQFRKMSFTIFYNKKTPFQAIKTRSSNSRKIDIFPKGLTHGFGPKMAIFPTFSFQAIQARKMSFTIFYNEKTAFQAIKTRSLKSGKSHIFPKGLTHDFASKMLIFPFFFLVIQARKISFTIFLTEKTPFQAIKTRS